MATVFKLSCKHKCALWEQAEKMRQGKFSAAALSGDDDESGMHTEPPHSSVDLDESLQLPRPTGEWEESEFDGHESEDSEEDPEVTTDSLHDEIQGVFDDWIFSLDRDDRKMTAMMLHHNYVK